MPEYRKEWLEKSKIDYFSPFVSLWLSCNSWYRSHYAELNANDRVLINRIKSDFTPRNLLYWRFVNLIQANQKKENMTKENISFRTNIELLHYSLEKLDLKSETGIICSFRYAVLDYNNKDNPTNLICKKNDTANAIRLDKLWVTNDIEILFPGIFEIIYQIRNMLVHGHLNPDLETHEVIRYCYLLLFDLMNGL